MPATSSCLAWHAAGSEMSRSSFRFGRAGLQALPENAYFCRCGEGLGPGLPHGWTHPYPRRDAAPTSREHGERLLYQERRLLPGRAPLVLREVCLLAQQEIRQWNGEGKIWELGQVPMSLQGMKQQCGALSQRQNTSVCRRADATNELYPEQVYSAGNTGAFFQLSMKIT